MEPLVCPGPVETPDRVIRWMTKVVHWPAAAVIPGAGVGIGDPQ